MKNIIFIVSILLFPGFSSINIDACTTAIIGKEASKNGIPMLWKNRDTSFLSNKVVFVKEEPFSYVGVINAKNISGRSVYAGLNSAGFAIMNSVAYNLPKISDESHDREGRIMADSLRVCRTVDDFELYIKRNLGSGLGSWANFGVIDADGNSAIFEVHNNGYKKLDTRNTEKKYYINANFSRSGKKGKGQGYIRFEQATRLFNKIPGNKISYDHIFQNIARDFGHPLAKHPSLSDLRKQAMNEALWVHNRNCINRHSTASVIIINGKLNSIKDSIATFWIILGEPVASIAVPVWVEADSVPDPLFKGKTSAICAEALRIKKFIHPFEKGAMKNYMDVSKLVNREGKGFLPILKKTEREIFKATEEFLKNKHTSKEYAAFQNKMATKALETLRKIK